MKTHRKTPPSRFTRARWATMIVALAVATLGVSAPAAQAEGSAGSAASVQPRGEIPARGARPQGARTAIANHGGPLLLGTADVYLIWYGTWPNPGQKAIVADFIANLGGSAYFAINGTYPDAAGNAVANKVQYAGTIDDPMYSQGFTLTDLQVNAVVTAGVAAGQLPNDPNGVYIVLGSADVMVDGLSTRHCGYHSVTTLDGSPIRYAFVGDPTRAPAACLPQETGPNGDASADGMVNAIAHLLNEVVTDPNLSAWYDRHANENADKCAWNFGTTYTTSNGAKANVALGGRDYLIQQNWVNAPKGYCSLSGL